MTDACIKAHERAVHFYVTEMGHPLMISSCFPSGIRFQDVVLSIESVDPHIVDMLVPVFVSLADVVDEDGVLRLVLGTKHVELQWLQDLINKVSVAAGFHFERQDHVTMFAMGEAPDGFRDAKSFIFVHRTAQQEREEKEDLTERLDRGSQFREEIISTEREWEIKRHREREEWRSRELQRERETSQEREGRLSWAHHEQHAPRHRANERWQSESHGAYSVHRPLPRGEAHQRLPRDAAVSARQYRDTQRVSYI
jgi:hypothetical protein